ncbi:PD-(D/E)XK nuclease family protein [Lewinella sp. IMCC34183]|uniref:PD-(D/E)XK nuclease family protein n=1 Tax=Lewinella sp. IMCC34183 TaxID=2248762 RepID=UPI000E281F60|nr:PD-(D/E)XK nuclease family protein [Lewinella sp. IMCC34183]
MIKIYLGLSFAGPLLPEPAPVSVDECYLDYPGLLRYLEQFYALSRNPANREALRTEQYRQVIDRHRELATTTTPFYAAAFAADHTATAEDLLGRRDELFEAGYRLADDAPAGTPERLAVLHDLEALLLDEGQQLELLPGPADRLTALLAALPDRRHPRLAVMVHEPADLLPPSLLRLLDRLRAGGDRVTHVPPPAAPDTRTDLGRWQEKLQALLAPDSGQPAARPLPLPLSGDGSLVVLRAERETHIAAYLARMVRDNPEWRPGVLMTVRNQTLDTAFTTEGLPSMGISSTSLARPSLQVLKLVTAFLWEPVEVQRIMEFVSLVTKPLERRLGQRLAVHLADTPGLFGNRWVYAVEQTFREMDANPKISPNRVRKAREQYDFWFRRRRYQREERVPKAEVRGLFVFLRNWALEAYEEDKEQTGLLVLSAQAERATELLDAQPEADLSYLDIERLVRTVYQPAPTQFLPAERGSLPVTFAPASTARLPGSGQPELGRLIWWDFVENDPTYFFSRYYPDELAFLRERGCGVYSPEQRNRLQLWQNLRPLLTTRDQLILCIPQRVDGTEMEPHALMGDLEAAFREADLPAITVDIDAAGSPAGLLADLRLPKFRPVPLQLLSTPRPHVRMERPAALVPRERETPSSMDDLLYYPHKWVFRHQLKLRKAPLLSIASENRLRGNLGHLFVERLLEEISAADAPFTRDQVYQWIDLNSRRLLQQEGAVLLEYGQEPEQVQFLLTIKKSAWTLVNFIQQNGWSIRGSEEELEGGLGSEEGQLIRGRADLVLERTAADGELETAVVDLKWRGKSVFRTLLMNARDIQLALYADLLQRAGSGRVFTAYYILRDAVLITRNELAFAGAQTVTSADDHTVVQRDTLRKILNTHDWRWEQLGEGLVEIRCADTSPELDDLYVHLPHDSLLEMKTDDASFDDYRSLIGLVR